MYFDAQNCQKMAASWLSGFSQPWLGYFILGLQGDSKSQPEPVFSLVKEAWSWPISTMFELFLKPAFLLVTFGCSLLGIMIKSCVMLVLLLPWLLVAMTTSVRFGSPEPNQSWMSPHE